MSYIVIAAADVRPGDELVVFEDSRRKRQRGVTRRIRVSAVATTGKETRIVTAGWWTEKHPGEAVAVYREERRSE